MTSNKQNFDVVISGGGLSGSLTALSLSKLKKPDGSLLSIAIIEKSTAEKSNHNNSSSEKSQSLFDDRVLALSHGSAAYLQKVAVWQTLKADACAITDIDISDRGHFGKARIAASEHGVNALGYVVDMALIGKAQLQALSQNKNVKWYSPDSISDIDWQGDFRVNDHANTLGNEQGSAQSGVQSKDTKNITIKLSSGDELNTSLLLACDGAHSPCRQLANIDVSHYDYQQCALIANVSTDKYHANKAYERFTEFGPIAMLPLKPSAGEKNRCSLVWTLSPEQAKRIQSLNDEAFKVELERAFGSWLGAITQVGKRDVYPLILLQAKQQTYHRMALVGNASHTIHPIAGQGFNLGLRDIAFLAKLLAQALKNKQDIGNFALLQCYEQNRTKDQREVIQLTDALVTLFANDLPPLVTGRNIALTAMNFFKPLKSALVNKTMGY
jgi:2-octaprenyl-6-methoxyphenol hydroxylase